MYNPHRIDLLPGGAALCCRLCEQGGPRKWTPGDLSTEKRLCHFFEGSEE